MKHLIIILALFFCSQLLAQPHQWWWAMSNQNRLDSNVVAFIASGNANITNPVLIKKLDLFAKELKKASNWTSTTGGIFKNATSLHPYVGGASITCSYNLTNTNTYRLTFFNSPTFNDTGMVTTNGSNQYARSPNGEYYTNILGTDKYTVISLQKLTSQPNPTNGAGAIEVSIAPDANSSFFGLLPLNNSSNLRQFYWNFTSNSAFLYPTTSTANLGEYYLLTGTYDGSTMRLFKNATQDASTASRTGNLSTTPFDNNYRFVAHCARPASLRANANSFLVGTFAFAAVFDIALNATDMARLYNLIAALKL